MNNKDIHLVLIHGFAFNKIIWAALAEQLAATYTVHVIDLPGYGEHAHKNACDLPTLCEQVLAQVRGPSKFIWVGWSLGGLIARTLAQVAPQNTQGVITLASTPQFIASPNWPCGIPYDEFHKLEQLFISQPEKALTRFFMLQGQGLDRTITRQLLALKKYSESLPLDVLLRDLQLLAHSDLRKLCQQLTFPQLNILGTADRLVPIAVLEPLKHLSALAQNVTIEGAGHILLLSHVTECLTSIHQYINESIII
jgi:pimeloyl-[acyl-carrier protein] methyl ester esterase